MWTVAKRIQDELLAFFHNHFSDDATARFGSDFLNPNDSSQLHADEEYDEWAEEDDGLGYYEDGVKRTLTDEQIEIFRHSELEALRREAERGSKRKSAPAQDEGEISDGDDGKTASGAATPSSSKSNKKKKKGAKRQKSEPKPDLRKRTWDVVEAGLDTLDYD